ncbi:MAG: GNAT family N-acetyltransferase [Candidatus Omnitrophota bacterium]
MKRAIAAILAAVFLFNDIAFAGDFQNLAPRAGTTLPEFQKRYEDACDRLREKALDDYIAKTIVAKTIVSRGRNIIWKDVTQKDIDDIGKVDITKILPTRGDKVSFEFDGKTIWQDILVAAIPGMFANRGQFAKVGLWKWNDLPVIFIDEKFYYDQDKLDDAGRYAAADYKASKEIISHEKDEIGKWEAKRLELLQSSVIPPDPKVFKDVWVKGNPEAKELAYDYHTNSRDLTHLFKKYKYLLNWEELHKAYIESGSIFDSEDTGDVNIAAGPTGLEGDEPGLEDYEPAYLNKRWVRAQIWLSFSAALFNMSLSILSLVLIVYIAHLAWVFPFGIIWDVILCSFIVIVESHQVKTGLGSALTKEFSNIDKAISKAILSSGIDFKNGAIERFLKAAEKVIAVDEALDAMAYILDVQRGWFILKPFRYNKFSEAMKSIIDLMHGLETFEAGITSDLYKKAAEVIRKYYDYRNRGDKRSANLSSGGPLLGGSAFAPLGRYAWSGIPAATYLAAVLSPLARMFVRLWDVSGGSVPAGGDTNSETEEDLEARLEDQVFEALIEVTRHAALSSTAGPDTRGDPINNFLVHCDSRVVARATFKYFYFLDEIERNFSGIGWRKMVKHRVGDLFFLDNLPKKYEEDVIKAVYYTIPDSKQRGKDWSLSRHMRILEMRVVEYLLDMNEDSVIEFLSMLELENDPEADLAQRVSSAIRGARRSLLLRLIYSHRRDRPEFSYGPTLFNSFAGEIADFSLYNRQRKMYGMSSDMLIAGLDGNDEEAFVALNVLARKLERAGIKSEDPYPVDTFDSKLGGCGKDYVAALERILDTSDDPFTLRMAFSLYERISDIDYDIKNEGLMNVYLKIARSSSDPYRRCQLISNLILSRNGGDGRKSFEKHFVEGLEALIGDSVPEPEILKHFDNYKLDGVSNRLECRKFMRDLTEIVLHPGRYDEERRTQEGLIKAKGAASPVLQSPLRRVVRFFRTYPSWRWQDRSKLTKRFLVSWYAAVVECDELANIFNLPSLFKKHKNERWYHWLTRFTGICVIWLSMPAVLAGIPYLVFIYFDAPNIIMLAAAAGSAVYAFRIHLLANIITHGFYNMFAFWAPLVVHYKRDGSDEKDVPKMDTPGDMPLPGKIREDNMTLPGKIPGTVPLPGNISERPHDITRQDSAKDSAQQDSAKSEAKKDASHSVKPLDAPSAILSGSVTKKPEAAHRKQTREERISELWSYVKPYSLEHRGEVPGARLFETLKKDLGLDAGDLNRVKAIEEIIPPRRAKKVVGMLGRSGALRMILNKKYAETKRSYDELRKRYPSAYPPGDVNAQAAFRETAEIFELLGIWFNINNSPQEAKDCFSRTEECVIAVQHSETGVLPVHLQRKLVLMELWRGDPYMFIENLCRYLTGSSMPVCRHVSAEDQEYQVRYMRRLANETLAYIVREVNCTLGVLDTLERDTGRREFLKDVRRSAALMLKEARENPFIYPFRYPVPSHAVSWDFPFKEYNPEYYVDREVLANDVTRNPDGYADPEDITKIGRVLTSYEGPVREDDKKRPLNPRGRTGLRGRGVLGKWGANFAVDLIVTYGEPGRVQMLSIKRADCGQWAIPGGMMAAENDIVAALSAQLEKKTGIKIDAGKAVELYRGYVDDARNTDNAWIETVVRHIHLTRKEYQKLPEPRPAGKYVENARWLMVDFHGNRPILYANHNDFVNLAIDRVKVISEARSVKDRRKGKNRRGILSLSPVDERKTAAPPPVPLRSKVEAFLGSGYYIETEGGAIQKPGVWNPVYVRHYRSSKSEAGKYFRDTSWEGSFDLLVRRDGSVVLKGFSPQMLRDGKQFGRIALAVALFLLTGKENVRQRFSIYCARPKLYQSLSEMDAIEINSREDFDNTHDIHCALPPVDKDTLEAWKRQNSGNKRGDGDVPKMDAPGDMPLPGKIREDNMTLPGKIPQLMPLPGKIPERPHDITRQDSAKDSAMQVKEFGKVKWLRRGDVTIPVKVCNNHREMFGWVKKLQKQGIADKNTTIINIDHHPDSANAPSVKLLSCGNWMRRLWKGGFSTGRRIWVRAVDDGTTLLYRPNPEDIECYGKTNIFDSIKALRGRVTGPAVITIDYDAIAPIEEGEVTDPAINRRVVELVGMLFNFGIEPVAINFTYSETRPIPKYLIPKTKNKITRSLLKSFAETGCVFEQGERIVSGDVSKRDAPGDMPLPGKISGRQHDITRQDSADADMPLPGNVPGQPAQPGESNQVRNKDVATNAADAPAQKTLATPPVQRGVTPEIEPLDLEIAGARNVSPEPWQRQFGGGRHGRSQSSARFNQRKQSIVPPEEGINLTSLLAGTELLKRFSDLNDGREVRIISIQEKIGQGLPEFKKALAEVPAGEYVAAAISTVSEGGAVIDYKIVIDKAERIDPRADFIWHYRPANESLKFVFALRVHADMEMMEIDRLSIDEGMQGSRLVSKFFGNLANTLERNYTGWSVEAIATEEVYAPDGFHFIPYVMKKYFSAEPLKEYRYSGIVGSRCDRTDARSNQPKQSIVAPKDEGETIPRSSEPLLYPARGTGLISGIGTVSPSDLYLVQRALLNQRIEEFFAQGYYISFARWEDDDDLPLSEDERDRIKYDKNTKFAVFVHNSDKNKFRDGGRLSCPLRIITPQGCVVKINQIYPNLPRQHGYGMTFVSLAMLMLYGDSGMSLKFFIKNASPDVLKSISKFDIFRVKSDIFRPYPDIRYSINGIIPHVDTEMLKRWKYLNERNKRMAQQPAQPDKSNQVRNDGVADKGDVSKMDAPGDMPLPGKIPGRQHDLTRQDSAQQDSAKDSADAEATLMPVPGKTLADERQMSVIKQAGGQPHFASGAEYKDGPEGAIPAVQQGARPVEPSLGPAEPIIEPANPGDIGAITKIWEEGYLTGGNMHPSYAESSNRYLRSIMDGKWMRPGKVFVARNNNEVIGYAIVSHTDDAGEGFIDEMTVRGSYQKAGVGTKLFAAALSWLRALPELRSVEAIDTSDGGWIGKIAAAFDFKEVRKNEYKWELISAVGAVQSDGTKVALDEGAADADSEMSQSGTSLKTEDLLSKLDNADADKRLGLKKQIIALGRSAIDDLIFAVGYPPDHASSCAYSALVEIAKIFPREVETAIRKELVRHPNNLQLTYLLENLSESSFEARLATLAGECPQEDGDAKRDALDTNMPLPGKIREDNMTLPGKIPGSVPLPGKIPGRQHDLTRQDSAQQDSAKDSADAEATLMPVPGKTLADERQMSVIKQAGGEPYFASGGQAQQNGLISDTSKKVLPSVTFRLYKNLSDEQKSDVRLDSLIEECNAWFAALSHEAAQKPSETKREWDIGEYIAVIGYYGDEPVGLYDYKLIGDHFESNGMYVRRQYRWVAYSLMSAAILEMKKNGDGKYYRTHPASTGDAQKFHRQFAAMYPGAVDIKESEGLIDEMYIRLDRFGEKSTDAPAPGDMPLPGKIREDHMTLPGKIPQLMPLPGKIPGSVPLPGKIPGRPHDITRQDPAKDSATQDPAVSRWLMGNPAEFLMMIKYDNGPGGLLEKALGEGFSIKSDICPGMTEPRGKRHFAARVYNQAVKPLVELGIFVNVNGKYKFSDMMIDLNNKTREHARNLINVAISVKLKTGKGDDKPLLRQGNIPPAICPFAGEAIKLHIVDYLYGKASLSEKDYTIKAWSGYAAPGQEPFLTEISKLTKDRVSFEDNIDELVSFARENIDDNTVTILPLERLNEAQIKELNRLKARVIYINLDGQRVKAGNLTNLEGLIGVGRAYLNDDNESFYRLYSLLTQRCASRYIPLRELKENPVDFINKLNFILKPIIPADTGEQIRLKHLQEVLLRAA